jgi:tetratricopeptide (TPR) repeat protein
MIGAGQTLRMMGEYDRAIRMGQRVLRSDKDDGDALFLVGAAHFQKGENQAAKRYLEHYLETGPELEIALEVEGMLQVVRGDVLPFPGAEDTVEN